MDARRSPWLVVAIEQQVGITAVAAALPQRVVTNEELAAAHPNWRMDLVIRRTGVVQRHIAGAEETALDLGEQAARDALRLAGLPAERVDGIIFCTQTPDHPMPPNACLLQSRLGLPKACLAFDITLACSGYVYGLLLARSLVTSASAKNVLLVTADTYSRLISSLDRATTTLFGDGAAATLVGAAGGRRILDFEMGSDGSAADCFIVPAGGARLPRSATTSELREDRSGNQRSLEHIVMDGAAVMAFVEREVPANVRTLLDRNRLRTADLDLVIFHQASRVALDHLRAVLEIPPERTYENLERVGNTVSASLGIALADAVGEGKLRHGMRVLLVGFGVGLSWGSALIEW